MRMCLNQHNIKGDSRDSHAQSHNFHAFTVIELLAVIAVALILVAMLLPAIPRRPHNGARIKCVNNLKNLGLAYRIYATDNNDRFPWELSETNGDVRINYLSDPANYIRALTNELSTPLVLHCPNDTRKPVTNWNQFTRANLSYFISADASETFPQSFLAGDRNITNINGRLPPGLFALSTAPREVGWDETIHKNQGNACMGDGSVQQLSSARLRDQLRNTDQTNKYIQLSIP